MKYCWRMWYVCAAVVALRLTQEPPPLALAQGPMPPKEQPQSVVRVPAEPKPDLIGQLQKEVSEIKTRVAEAQKPPVQNPPPLKTPLLAAPPVVAPLPEPTDPTIEVECPTTRQVGKIIVVKASKLANVCKMLVDISPEVPADDMYRSEDGKLYIFTVPDEGVWTISITASSATGGLGRIIRQVTVGDAGGAAPAPNRAASKMAVVLPRQFDYGRWVAANVKLIPAQTRKADAQVMASTFRSAEGGVRTKIIRESSPPENPAAELFRFTNRGLESLGPDAEGCREFLSQLQALFNQDVHSLERGQEVWLEVARALEKVAR